MVPTPTPTPLESGSGGGPMEAVGTMGGQMGTISLGVLIQYINQRTYSDLLNLAEILPRKSDVEKKVDIVQYAQRTRQLYVRLLALVKWAASASKVDKCNHIMALLEKQNNLFTDTADKLYHITKGDLVRARLPHFHIPAAVEVLTTGTYDRLPMTIRQRILPPDPITAIERKQTLTRLEQIVRHRLVTFELPPQMRTLRIENGRVRFTVDHEFEVSLTLMGDGTSEPWRLLEIEILVEDKETGDGKPLVHQMQIAFIHQLVQSRIQDNPNPLHETYMVLHAFCQALQLEVLCVQTKKLLEDRLDYHIRIEEYLQGKSLTLTYWRELAQRDPSAQLGYRLTVQVDPTEPSKPLMVLHTPSLSSKESEIAERAIRSDHLSIERLLVHTIYLRTKARLSDLKQDLDSKLGADAEKCQLSGSPAVLHVPVLQPNLRSEQLLITVDTHTGILLPHVPQYDNCPIISDLQQALNQDRSKVDDLISELRYWLMMRRTEKTLQHLPATAHERLPLMYYATHPLNTLGKHKAYITFHKHPGYVLILEFNEKEGSPCEVEQSLYFMVVKQASIEDNPDDDTVETSLPKSYMRAYDLEKLDSFVCTHGPSTKVDVVEPGERALGGKRKLQLRAEPASKRVKVPAYFLPDVAQCVAMCDMKLPLIHLSRKLRERNVFNTGEQIEEGGMGVLLRLIDLPTTENLSKSTIVALRKHLLSASIRTQQAKGSRVFGMEYLFTHSPVTSLHGREQGPRRSVYFTYEVTSAENMSATVDAILADWIVISSLYELVLTFAAELSASRAGVESAGSSSSCSSNIAPKTLSEMVRVKSFNYKSITVAYGDSFDAFVVLRYSAEKKSFVLSFGMSGEGVWATNPHTVMQDHLQDLVNHRGHMGLVDLAITLHHTYHPLLAISKLSPTIHLGVIDKRQQPIKNFTILPQSPTRVSIVYRNVYCLNVDMLPNGLVAVRDGAFSSFDTSKVIEEFIPVQGLKAFLSKYVDESAINRRRSQSEDDNPPTPIPMDDTSWPTPKAGSPARHGPMTPPISSNPHTPASPHPGGITQTSAHSGFVSSPATSGFSLASPPSLPGMNPSPAMLPHQSPGGGFLGANSPSAPQHSVASPVPFLAPSPAAPHSVPMHSPASAFMQGPVGTSSSYTSRVLPNKPYAAAVPTTLTHDAFYTLCSPAQIDEGGDNSLVCLLEQFLGMTYLKRHFQQQCRCEGIKPLGDIEPGSIQFKTDTLSCQMLVQSSPAYNLVLKLQPLPEHTEQWNSDELQVLEKFFSVKVLVPPFRPFAVQSFYSILKFPIRVLKDCIRIMQLELMPTPQQQQQMKWNIQWCLTNPPIGPHIAPPGLYVVVVSRSKILFFLQLIRTNIQLSPETEPPSLMLPVVYDTVTNKTQMAERREQSNNPSVTLQVINEIMGRVAVQQNELSLFPCIRELVCNLTLGPDGNVIASPVTPASSQGTPTSSGGTVSQALTSPHLVASPHMSSPVTPGGSSSVTAAVQPSLTSTMSQGLMSSSTGTITTNVPPLTSSGMMANMAPGSHFTGPKPGGTVGHMSQTMGTMGSMGPQGPMQNMQGTMCTMSGMQSGHMQQPMTSMAGGIMQQQPGGGTRGMQGPGPTNVQGGPNQVGVGSGNMQGMQTMQGGGGMQGLSAMQGGPGGMQGGPNVQVGPGGMQTGPGGMQTGPGGMQTGPGGMQSGPGGMQAGPGGMQTGPGGMQAGPGGMQGGPGGMQGGPGGMQGGPGGMQGGPGGMQGGFGSGMMGNQFNRNM
ncbi:mediator of RNA polymerase II transcription subunit 14-like [Macrobrachium nipponense]|uniref:mediator of RNA polymerase II transcription subunit 14-like n=1 Tax=Macrobrachium nipponense TaxID=159736 RepID=UPI0030C85740